jgi:hypothetical protein
MRTTQTVAHVAITCADDTVALMEILTDDGRGGGSTTTAEAVNMLVARAAVSFSPEKVPVKGWTPIDANAIPADRTFRNALRHDGKAFSHCPIHSKEIALAMVRVHREPRFAALDAKRMAAGRKGDKALVERLDAEADALANLTGPVKACTTVEELKKTLQTLGVE